jgi:hypothetical protein
MKQKPTRAQLTEIYERRIAHRWRIQSWRQVQMVYMSCVASLLMSSMNSDPDESHMDICSTEPVEDIPLYLPSSLSTTLHSQHHTAGIFPGLLDKEVKLRIAQADDALAEVRRQRRIVTGLVLFKKLNLSGTGQKSNTHIRLLFKRFSNKTECIAERYRMAYQVLVKFNAGGDWCTRLKELHCEDI